MMGFHVNDFIIDIRMLRYFLYFSLLLTFNRPEFFVNCGQSSNSIDEASIQKDEDSINQGANFVKEFKRINDRLVGLTHSCDAELNMDLVEKIYQEDISLNLNQRPRQIKAKKLIMELKTLLDRSTCNARGYDIAALNFLALDGTVTKKDKSLSYCFSRLDNVFVHYLERHAGICREVYFDSFKQKLGRMNKDRVKHVDYFADNAIYQITSKRRDENKSRSRGQRLMLVANINMNPRPKYILQRLRTLAEGHRDKKALYSYKDKKTGMVMVDIVKFGKLFNQFLVEPCKYYEEQLGPDVFEPVSFEREFHKVDESNSEFYRAWGRYRLCVNFNRESDKKLRETIDYAISNPDE